MGELISKLVRLGMNRLDSLFVNNRMKEKMKTLMSEKMNECLYVAILADKISPTKQGDGDK